MTGNRAVYGEEREILSFLENVGLTGAVQIGEGGFNRVYRVFDRRRGGFLAVKVGQSRKVLKAEAAIMKEIAHPLFARYRGFYERERFCCLLMEYVPGCTLEELLSRRGGFGTVRAAYVARELAEGLSYLHRKELIFRDLKPGNIMIRQDGRVKLVDLGCVCRLDGNVGSIAGTPGYAAPEQLKPGEAAGIYSDSFALGLVLRGMLTDRRAHGRKENADKERIRLSKLNRLIAGCTGEETYERIGGMRQIISCLSDVEKEGLGTHTGDPARLFLKQDIIKRPNGIR